MRDGSIMVIGIAGGTGSGKTTITRASCSVSEEMSALYITTTTIRLTTA